MTDSKETPKARFAPGMEIAEQYLIERELSAGAMGVTYVARDNRLRRQVVIKTLLNAILDREGERELFLARFEQEAVLAAQLSHRAIIPIFQFGEHEGVLWYAMEYINKAQALSAVILEAAKGEEDRYLPLDDVRAYFMDAASGLAAIHDVGAVHRDVKTDNLLCYRSAEGPGLKLLDFGVAHIEDMDLTRTGQAVGTPSYLAPEYLQAVHAMERPNIDGRLDLFALGVTLYRALTANTKPFIGTDWFEVRKAVMTHTPTLPSEIRPGLPRCWDSITMKLLAKRPDNRYQSAREVYEALKNLEAVPAYESPADDVIALPNETATVAGGRPAAGSIGSLPDLSRHTASGLAEAEDSNAGASQGVEATRGAQVYSAVEPPKGRFASLPGRLRLGIAGLLLVVVIVVGLLMAQGILRGASDVAKQPLLDPAAAASPPDQITADELLRDQDEARRQRLLEQEREARLEDGGKDSAAVAKATKSKRRRPRRRSARSSASKATLASRDATGPASGGEGAAAPDEPRRKKAPVVTFASDEEGTAPGPAGAKRLGIPTGFKADAKLETPVSSAAPNTLVTAVLPKGVRFADIGEVLPRGTRVLGKASFRVQGRAGRVEIRFTKLVLPDRTERAFSGLAVMGDGQAGLVASVTKRDERGRSNAAEAALDVVDGVLGGTAAGSATRRYTQDARSDARELRQSQTVVSVAAGIRFKVQFATSL